MRIVMARDLCVTNLPACEECFATFLLHGCYPDRSCIVDVAEDGRPDTTLVLRYEGSEEQLVIDDSNRELIAYEGWPRFVKVQPSFRTRRANGTFAR